MLSRIEFDKKLPPNTEIRTADLFALLTSPAPRKLPTRTHAVTAKPCKT